MKTFLASSTVTVTIALAFLMAATQAQQAIPSQFWGKWIVRRVISTRTISCWGDKESKALLGTEIEYSSDVFQWKDVVTKDPVAVVTTTTAEEFQEYASGGGSNGSYVDFAELGVKVPQTTEVSIQHPAADITGGTIEIPGDEFLVKDKNTIVFSACNVYFEAKREKNQAHK
jgi:hypothetical protein